MTITELPKIEITKDEETWLLECWNHLKAHNNINTYKHIKVKTLKSVSKDFKPWKIDDRLIRENVEITLKGVIALNLEEEVFNAGNKVFSFIKKELLDDIDKTDFDLNFVADCINEERRLTKISFKLFSNEGLRLWNSAGTNKGYGYDSITIKDSSFNTYMDYDSMEDVYISKQKSIEEYQNKHSTREPISHNNNNNDLNNTLSSNLFPLELLTNTRGYIINMGKQASACYDSKLYDASLVIIRKLIETLIIECFERHGIEENIKGRDGHYFFLSDLIVKFLSENQWSINRNTSKSLPKIKSLGDLSAHNRRFSAKKPDIDNIKIDLRIIIEDLIHLIDYPNWNK